MRKVLLIIIILVLGAFSYFVFVVNGSKQENEEVSPPFCDLDGNCPLLDLEK